MFESDPDLSPDLNWMLQSGQASSEALAEALVEEYYGDVYRLALGLLDDPVWAQSAAQDALASAVLNRFRYQGSGDVRTWLVPLALEICDSYSRRLRRRRAAKSILPVRASADDFGASVPTTPTDAALWLNFDRLERESRLCAALYFILGWPIEEIAPVLSRSEHEITLQLKIIRREFIEALKAENAQDLMQEEANIDDLLRRSLQARFPEPEIDEEGRNAAVRKILRQVNRRGVRRQNVTSFKEIVFTAAIIAVVAAFFWIANRLFPEPEPISAPVAARSTEKPQPTRTRRPTSTPVRQPYEPPFPAGAFYTIRPRDTLASIAQRFGTTSGEIRRLNRIPDGAEVQYGQQLLIPGVLTPAAFPSPTPVTPGPTPEPVSTEDDPISVFERSSVIHGNWQTVWLDAALTFYGSPAYRGPAQAYRMQLWFAYQGGTALLALGPADGTPAEVIMNTDEEFLFALPGQNQPWFTPFEENENLFTQMKIFFFWPHVLYIGNPQVYSQVLLDELRVRWNNERATSNENELIIEAVNEKGEVRSRTWIDPQSGLLFRSETYSEGVTVSVVEYLNVQIDTGLPVELFDPWLPWRGGFAQNASGKPIPAGILPPAPEPELVHPLLPKATPPAGFDPAKQPLTFQFPSLPSYFDLERVDSWVSAELFAGEYFLADIPFYYPLSMICERSPDGRYIAFSPYGEIFDEMNVRPFAWLDLTQPATIRQLPFDLAAGYYAFSPDGSQLAVSGSSQSQGSEAVYIVDLQAGDYRHLIDFPETLSMVWSPDGGQLALLPSFRSSYFRGERDLLIVQVESGDIEFQTRVEYSDSGQLIQEGLPTEDWGIEFPATMGDLQSCAQLPNL